MLRTLAAAVIVVYVLALAGVTQLQAVLRGWNIPASVPELMHLADQVTAWLDGHPIITLGVLPIILIIALLRD
jgi:hypothetical protein